MLMALVAMSAAGMSGYAQFRRLRRLSQEYRSRATYHRQLKKRCSGYVKLIAELKSKGLGVSLSGNSDDALAGHVLSRDGWSRRAAYEADLERKYLDAARRPWLSVPLDPPEPE
jgi:hypothetical protein